MAAASVRLTRHGSIGVLTLDHPPVNAVDASLRAGLISGLRQAASDEHIAALVLVGAGKTFIAGADLTELSTGIGSPSYGETLAEIEASRKSVTAVLHGPCLGAGLEIALACHYRLALPDAKIGLPEVTLGIVPGAGATQRLPRLIGPLPALDLLLSGASIDSARALELGLIDAIVTGDPVAAGVVYAREVIANRVTRNSRSRTAAADGFTDAAIAAVARTHSKALKGRTTQFAMIEAVKGSLALPFEDGLALEKALSDASLRTPESLALRHMFFAERATGSIPQLGKDLRGLPVDTVAVVGAGTMGSGIAMAFGDAGYKVMLVDARADGLERGRKIIRSTYDANAKRGRMSLDAADAAADRITLTLDLTALAGADLVVEAVFEDTELKKSVLGQLDRIVGPKTILATNTSSLSVTELGAATGRPDKVLGLHFFSPANVMKLLEIVRSRDTSNETLATGLEIARRIRKIPVVSADGFGFIGNRMMLDGAFREAEQMMLEGAGIEQIDRAIETFGFAMGPSRVNDMAGVDIGTLVRRQLLKRATRADPYCVVSDALTPMGRMGQKSGKGFYSYAADPRVGASDPEVEEIIERLAAERGIARRTFGDEEIVERFVLQLINVGADILDEGVAYRAADLDVVWVYGYGFPRHVGGPMFYADSLGLDHVVDRIDFWHERKGDYWKPSALLQRLAASGSSFAAFDRRRT
ncbi:MAG: 3-hydroxyacyl-CoA dehydrogenase NAD-binding domain-containing protein [Pseudomonadota bacterium]|nr:3-hydroxyacyl-CoA dehydrogenase NAD-binding domain-containing protein [Pseudomonadota bacterium]